MAYCVFCVMSPLCFFPFRYVFLYKCLVVARQPGGARGLAAGSSCCVEE